MICIKSYLKNNLFGESMRRWILHCVPLSRDSVQNDL